MQMPRQPRAMSPHIGIYGRRNAGKSSLLNFLLGYELALQIFPAALGAYKKAAAAALAGR